MMRGSLRTVIRNEDKYSTHLNHLSYPVHSIVNTGFFYCEPTKKQHSNWGENLFSWQPLNTTFGRFSSAILCAASLKDSALIHNHWQVVHHAESRERAPTRHSQKKQLFPYTAEAAAAAAAAWVNNRLIFNWLSHSLFLNGTFSRWGLKRAKTRYDPQRSPTKAAQYNGSSLFLFLSFLILRVRRLEQLTTTEDNRGPSLLRLYCTTHAQALGFSTTRHHLLSLFLSLDGCVYNYININKTIVV